MSTVDISSVELISFFALFYTDVFKARLKSLEVPSKICVQWITTAAVPVTNEVMKSNEENVSGRMSSEKTSQFLIRENLVLRDCGTEKICQVLIEPLAVLTYVPIDGRFIDLFFHFFCERNVSATPFNGSRVL